MGSVLSDEEYTAANLSAKEKETLLVLLKKMRGE